MNSQLRLFTAINLLCLSAGGCGVQPETLQSLHRVVEQSAITRSGVDPAPRVTRVKATFGPPYAGRVDPFSYPNEATLEGTDIDTSIKSAAHVDVVGFADLGTPRVFLRARDKTHSLTEGETLYGVEVLAIRPPAVRLQMGSLTWTATMFDKNSADRLP